MPDYTLPRAERLRSLTAIRRLFSDGQGGFVYPFRYTYIVERGVESDGAGHGVEVMFSVPKKFHKRANRRNLLKRRSREAYRLSREVLTQRLHEQKNHVQLALVYSTKECHTYKTISHAIQRILQQIAQNV